MRRSKGVTVTTSSPCAGLGQVAVAKLAILEARIPSCLFLLIPLREEQYCSIEEQSCPIDPEFVYHIVSTVWNRPCLVSDNIVALNTNQVDRVSCS